MDATAHLDEWPKPTQRTGKVRHSRLRTDWLPLGEDRWEWVLLEPVVVVYKHHKWRIPALFRFDFASIRYRWVNALVPKNGRRVSIPAMIHDWLYSQGRGDIPYWADNQRKYADDIFHTLMRACGANPVRSGLAFGAVRLFGGKPWRT